MRAAAHRVRGDALVELVDDRAQEALERGDVGADPAGAVGDPGPGRAGQATQPGGVGDQLLGLRGELGEVGLQRGVVVRVGEGLVPPCQPSGDPLGELPVDRGRSPASYLSCRFGYWGASTLTRYADDHGR